MRQRETDSRRGRWLLAVALPVLVAGCHTDMWTQPKYHNPMQEEANKNGVKIFPDGMVSRPLVKGTVARDHLREDDAFFTGYANGKMIDYFPVPVSKELILRGQDRYTVYCVPCHGQLGDGKGMIATRGFQIRRPVGNYHTDRLRKMPVGHFYDVITNGYGAMYSYASRIEPQDRWAIVSYIRALQFSQDARIGDLTPEEIRGLSAKPEAPAAAGGAGH